MTYEFSADQSRIDHARVHALLTDTYWAKDRSREKQDAATAGSRPYGVYLSGTGEQVAYARVVTDGVTFGWLADVVVDPAHRGRGVGRLLVSGIVDDLAPLGLKRVLLRASAEGRGLYDQLGWTTVDAPDEWMVRY